MSGPLAPPPPEVEDNTTPYAFEVTNTPGGVLEVPVGAAIVVEGVQIPGPPGAQRLDELDDVTGADAGVPGQTLVKDIDGQWRPALVSGGGGLNNYVVLQATPAATWSITHTLGRHPQVTVLDTNNVRVWPDVEYGSINTVTITHAAPLAGIAILT